MKRKVLFIDRDGTIIVEPPVDFQVDSLEKLEFVPGAISALRSIAGLDFEFVLASNQDGLGTESFPLDTYLPAHQKMIRTLAGEGFRFDRELVDPTMPEDNAPTRKPGTAMFTDYLEGDYDIAGSFVIGDRMTDMLLARNLGCRGILLSHDIPADEASVSAEGLASTVAMVTDDWWKVAEFLRASDRSALVERKTAETSIRVKIDLDGRGESFSDTGLKFFDHMLDQISHHGGVALQVRAKGDLEVDEHHTMEDVGIAIGEAISRALGDKAGIERYGFVLPMDECEACVLLDFGGRIDFQWDVPFTRDMVGDVPSEMFSHFFKSMCAQMKCNMHISAHGENNHHLIEGVFKAFARALKMAVRRNVFSYEIPSSKGVL